MPKFSAGNRKGSKLSPEQVYDIRDKWTNHGWTQARLCRFYAVSINTISRICSGQTHQNVGMAKEVSEQDAIANRMMALQQAVREDARLAAESTPEAIAKRESDKALVFLANLEDPTMVPSVERVTDKLNKMALQTPVGQGILLERAYGVKEDSE